MNYKFLTTILLGATLTLASSCEEKLNVEPVSDLAPELVGAEDAPKLLQGIYDALQNGNTNFYYLSYATEDLSADNLRYRATFFQHGEVNDNNILANNVLVSRYFNGPYVVIQRSNDLLEILNSSTSIPEDIKQPLLGQTYFLRAYGYYRLVTLFGGVPIVFDRGLDKVPRNSEDEVYAQIISDLEASIANGPEFTNSKFASVQAAKALLARVYLIRGEWALAKQYADEVINSGEFALTSDYASMFTAPYESSEHIFKLNYTVTEAENSLDYFLQHPTMPGSGRAELPVDPDLVEAYEGGDERLEASIVEIPESVASSGFYTKKYQDPTGNGAVPMYILRIAEMYLISAEAQYQISGNATDPVVLERINAVRTNRGLEALTSVDLYDIIHERRVELAFEGTRWTDMKRTPSETNPQKSMATVFLEAKGRSANDQLYPIPQSAIDRNELLLPNNPGY